MQKGSVRERQKWSVTVGVTLALFASFAVGAGEPGPTVWGDQSDHIVIRYERSGGRVSRVGTQVADWTLYDDGLVVWANSETPPTPGFACRVWTGRLDKTVAEGLTRLAVDSGFSGLESNYRPGLRTSAAGDEVDPAPLPLDTVAETLLVVLPDGRHRVTIRPAGWPGAPEPFQRLRNKIFALEPRNGRPFVPTSFILRVVPLDGPDPADLPVLPAPFARLDLAGEAAKPLMLGRADGETLARTIAEFGTCFTTDEGIVTLELWAVPPRPP